MTIKSVMIDPPGGWKFGFPKVVSQAEYQEIQEMDVEQGRDWLIKNGYPAKLAESGFKWCRFMFIEEDDV